MLTDVGQIGPSTLIGIMVIGSLVAAFVNFDKGNRAAGIAGVLGPIAALAVAIVMAVGGLIVIVAFGSEDDLFAAVIWLIVAVIAVGFLVLIVGFVWSVVGAVRLARPDSRWAARRYGTAKLARARQRYSTGGTPG